LVAGPGGRRCVHKTRLSAFDELDDEAEVRNYSFPNSFTQENHFFAIMPNSAIVDSISSAWSDETAAGKKLLDLSCGGGDTSVMLAKLGFQVVATDYGVPRPMANGIARVRGGDLNCFLPFQSASFDGVDLVEVIEHIENQPQLVREINGVLKPGETLLVNTPNVLNVMSRLRFLFTGFLRGRVRPVHYMSKPGRARPICVCSIFTNLLSPVQLWFQNCRTQKTRVKFASRLFMWLCWPWMRLFSLIAVIHAEKDPIQRRYNWQILSYLFRPALLLSDNIVVKARKADEDSPSA
jgi:SAM-dependent methyltransferase